MNDLKIYYVDDCHVLRLFVTFSICSVLRKISRLIQERLKRLHSILLMLIRSVSSLSFIGSNWKTQQYLCSALTWWCLVSHAFQFAELSWKLQKMFCRLLPLLFVLSDISFKVSLCLYGSFRCLLVTTVGLLSYGTVCKIRQITFTMLLRYELWFMKSLYLVSVTEVLLCAEQVLVENRIIWFSFQCILHLVRADDLQLAGKMRDSLVHR